MRLHLRRALVLLHDDLAQEEGVHQGEERREQHAQDRDLLEVVEPVLR
jgi:hypothetical protein